LDEFSQSLDISKVDVDMPPIFHLVPVILRFCCPDWMAVARL